MTENFKVNDTRIATVGVPEEEVQQEVLQEVPPEPKQLTPEEERDKLLNSIDIARPRRKELIRIIDQSLQNMHRNTLPGRKEIIGLSGMIAQLSAMQEGLMEGLLINLLACEDRFNFYERELFGSKVRFEALQKILLSKNACTQEEIENAIQDHMEELHAKAEQYRQEMQKQAEATAEAPVEQTSPQEPTETPPVPPETSEHSQ
jgi:hypothetical protein